MEKGITKTIYLEVSEIERLCEIVEKELSECIDSQIYVEKVLYQEMCKNGKLHSIYEYKTLKGPSYSRRDEKRFAFYDEGVFTTKLAVASFNIDCKEFIQLTEFESKGICYKHCAVRMERIIVIYAK